MTSYDLLLQNISHRDTPLSLRTWQNYQEWHDTVLFHFEVPKEALEELIPKELTLDTFENKAWISIICYYVKNLHERNFFRIPFISNFTELNIRTYVKYNGLKATYLLSPNRDLLRSTIYSKLIHGLSYKLSEIERTGNLLDYDDRSENRIYVKYFKKETKSYTPNSIDQWLTERYSRFYNENNNLFKVDIHHSKWKLRKMEIIPIKIKAYVNKILLLDDCYPTLSHFGEKLEVLSWAKKRII